jgi:predicted nucleic acid-binding protein
MPPIYTVLASVVDIRSDTPRANDRFLVDTNVWVWEHYPAARVPLSGVIPPQIAEYEAYLQLTRDVGASRYRTALTLAELAHLIERNECDVYAAAVSPVSLKDYRHNLPAERARVIVEIQRAWDRIKADSEPLSLALDDALADAALARLASVAVDGYDLFSLEAMTASGVTQILSDDGDFCTAPGVEVFTANPRALAAARSQGRLLAR